MTIPITLCCTVLLQKGDIVCIKSESLLSQPDISQHGSGKLFYADKARKAVVNFTDGKRWKEPLTQLEIAEPITVGDRVRVSPNGLLYKLE